MQVFQKFWANVNTPPFKTQAFRDVFCFLICLISPWLRSSPWLNSCLVMFLVDRACSQPLLSWSSSCQRAAWRFCWLPASAFPRLCHTRGKSWRSLSAKSESKRFLTRCSLRMAWQQEIPGSVNIGSCRALGITASFAGPLPEWQRCQPMAT